MATINTKLKDGTQVRILSWTAGPKGFPIIGTFQHPYLPSDWPLMVCAWSAEGEEEFRGKPYLSIPRRVAAKAQSAAKDYSVVRLRNGTEVRIVSHDSGCEHFPIVGVLPCGSATTWTREGMPSHSGDDGDWLAEPIVHGAVAA